MMRVHALMEKGRVTTGPSATAHGDLFGRFKILCKPTGAMLLVIACDGVEVPWDHVSVSVRGDGDTAPTRCPTWEEMCWVKEMFWEPEDCVVQFHPPRAVYVNTHNFVLHLWRPLAAPVPLPPPALV